MFVFGYAFAKAVKPAIIIQTSTYRKSGFDGSTAAAVKGPMLFFFEGKANGTRNRTTTDKEAEHRMAGTARCRTADHPGAGGLFCAGDGLRHLHHV